MINCIFNYMFYHKALHTHHIYKTSTHISFITLIKIEVNLQVFFFCKINYIF